ncbi:hypothetical protein [Streptomyces sp. NPDC087437]
MPAPVIAERIGWLYLLPPLRKRLALIRPSTSASSKGTGAGRR